MNNTRKAKCINGVSLLEVVIGVGIIAIVLVGLAASLQFFLKSGFLHTEKIQSTHFLEEGVEVTRFLKNVSWSNIGSLISGTTYYLSFDSGAWSIGTTATSTNSFTRTVKLYDVYRLDSTDQIVASTSPSANTLDPDTRLVTVSVVSPTSRISELSMYMTNILNN